MRALPVLLACTALLFAAAAHAEKRIFIIASNTNGYGVDQCLANGESCGQAIATSYCRSREFSKALSYRKVDRDDITGAIPNDRDNCPKGLCDDFVAIECGR